MTARPIPDRSSITLDTPLRLEEAAQLAFPTGSTTVAGLRREIAAGRLIAWRVGGRHLTSLAEIGRMLDQCRVQPKDHASGIEKLAGPKRGARQKPAGGSSSTEAISTAQAAAKATAKALRERLRNTSPENTKSPDANVVSMPSRSRTC